MSAFTDSLRKMVCVTGLAAGMGLSVATANALSGQAFDVKVSHFQLANGMDVLVVPDHRAPVVTHMVWYRTGAADEPPGKSGIAHFLEHLLFKGTKTVPSGEFSKIVQRLGGQDNAYTSQDFTAYFQRIARTHLETVMRLEADRMANLALSEDDVATEREVVLEERRLRIENDPRGLFHEQMMARLYGSHPYGLPIIGWQNEIETLTPDDALAFYRRYYTPANAILVVAGDVTAEDVRPLAAQYYGVLPNTAARAERNRPAEARTRQPHRLTMTDIRLSDDIFYRAYLAPSARTAKGNQAAALEVAAYVLGGGPTSRLYQRLVVKDKLANSASAWYGESLRDYGNFSIDAIPAPEVSLTTLEQAVDALIAEALSEGLTADEIARAKSALVIDSTYDRDSQFRLAYIFGAALATDQTVADVLNWTAMIEAVSAEEIATALTTFLSPRNAVTGYLKKPVAQTQEGAQPESSSG